MASFRTYAEAQDAVDDMVASEGLTHSAVCVRPLGLRLVAGEPERAANDMVARWAGLGLAFGACLGIGFGAVNVAMGLVDRPAVVFATLLVTGALVGGVGGLGAGALAAHGLARETAATEPLFRASRYEVVVDGVRTDRRRRMHGDFDGPAAVIDLRDAVPDDRGGR